MDLRQLQSLLAVVDHGGFTAAARALHTVQSNVSAHVARLEKELGAVLIDRASGDPTPEGSVVIARARRIQAELDSLPSDVASLRAEVTGPVSIGIIGTTARWLVPHLVDTMAARYPRVQVVVHDATTASLLLQLDSGAVDLAVLSLPVPDPDVMTRPLFIEHRLLAMPVDHRLAHIDRLNLSDLDGEPLLVEPRGHPFREQLEMLFAERGLHLVVKAEVDGTRLVASLAFEGFGVAILPASAVSNRPDLDWRTAPIDDLPGRAVGLATRRHGLLSAPARALREVLEDVIGERAEEQPGIHPTVET
jgi:DNA-binding transcriptional LysR family regulator